MCMICAFAHNSSKRVRAKELAQVMRALPPYRSSPSATTFYVERECKYSCAYYQTLHALAASHQPGKQKHDQYAVIPRVNLHFALYVSIWIDWTIWMRSLVKRMNEIFSKWEAIFNNSCKYKACFLILLWSRLNHCMVVEFRRLNVKRRLKQWQRILKNNLYGRVNMQSLVKEVIKVYRTN